MGGLIVSVYPDVLSLSSFGLSPTQSHTPNVTLLILTSTSFCPSFPFPFFSSLSIVEQMEVWSLL